MYWFWFGATLALGLVVGSFLNVCIWRMPNDLSVVQPPSHCPTCKTQLRARDLVPVLSFLAQGRKCRYCKAPISWRYAIVESLTGGAFLLLFLVHGASPALLFDAVFVAALIAIFAIDLEHYIIPHELNWACILSGFGRETWGYFAAGGLVHPIRVPVPWSGVELWAPASLFGALFGAGVFLAIGFLGERLFKKEAMGGGDLRLAAGIGAHLGWVGALTSFILAVAMGAVIGVLLIALRFRKREEYIPFGPFMVLGALAVVYAGKWVVPAFLALYHISVADVVLRTWP